MKSAYLALMPKGFAWDVNQNADLDKEITGIAENFETTRLFLSSLAFIRNPELTSIFEDLEKEYGITPDSTVSMADRVQRLTALVYPTINNGSEDNLETKLRESGFDVYVYQNDPAIDPAQFLEDAFKMTAGQSFAVAGNEAAYAGVQEGELLVNGDIFEMAPQYLSVAGALNAVAGNNEMVAGRFDEVLKTKIEYPTPTDPNSWPFIFFVGGAATFDMSGKITDIDRAIIPTERRLEFIRIILKYKPLNTWATLVVLYV